MKNVLAKGLVFGMLAGAFCVNCGEVEAMTKLRMGLSNTVNKITNNKDEAKKIAGELKNLKIALNDYIRDLENLKLKGNGKTSSQTKEAKLTTNIANVQAKIKELERKLSDMERLGINTASLKSRVDQVEKLIKLIKKAFDTYLKHQNEGNLSAFRSLVRELANVSAQMARDLHMENDMLEIVNGLMRMANRGRSQDTQDMWYPHNYGNPGDGDYYLNYARYDIGSGSNEYTNRITSPNGGRIDNRNDSNFRYPNPNGVGSMSLYSHEPIEQDPNWVISPSGNQGVQRGANSQNPTGSNRVGATSPYSGEAIGQDPNWVMPQSGNSRMQRSASSSNLGGNSLSRNQGMPQSGNQGIQRSANSQNSGGSSSGANILEWDSDGGYGYGDGY